MILVYVPQRERFSGPFWGTVTELEVENIERKWRNWQTRRIQVPKRSCETDGGFEGSVAGTPVWYPTDATVAP